MDKNITEQFFGNRSEIKSDLYVHKTSDEIPLEEFLLMVPPKQLLLNCREKLKLLTNEYHDLLEKVEKWQTSCNLNFELEQELEHQSYEVQRLQQAVSDLQVCVENEREQVLHLHAENDRLQMQIAEDRKRIDFLLNLNNVSNHEVTYFMNIPSGSIPVRRRYMKVTGEISDQKDSDKVDSMLQQDNEDILQMECKALRRELEQHIRLHREQVNTLLKDRDLMKKEWNKGHKKLQNLISKLSNR
ncbi:hypothetical protein L9F63_022254 [Diploptera punctata]|uniref:Uncharacterized protein n=1 Tax=Diploptera punctata TaxID=6984 RepID=A0AAD7ZP88_DIPPU|nr:hypothetical protein L9F63_022254 [Diploptera punctata]